MSARPQTTPERLAVLESEMSSMGEDVAEIKADLKELLALRHKGAGAFQLAAALYGTGIIGGVMILWKWLTS